MPNAESGSARSASGAIWPLMSSQNRPINGTEKKSDAAAAAARPPGVRSESVLRRIRRCDMRRISRDQRSGVAVDDDERAVATLRNGMRHAGGNDVDLASAHARHRRTDLQVHLSLQDQ